MQLKENRPLQNQEYWFVASRFSDFPETGKAAALVCRPMHKPDGSPAGESEVTEIEVREGDAVFFIGREWRVAGIHVGSPPPPGVLGASNSFVELEPLAEG